MPETLEEATQHANEPVVLCPSWLISETYAASVTACDHLADLDRRHVLPLSVGQLKAMLQTKADEWRGLSPRGIFNLDAPTPRIGGPLWRVGVRGRVAYAQRYATDVRAIVRFEMWRKPRDCQERRMHIRAGSLICAVAIVAVAMAGGTWLQDYRQFPWVLFMGVIFPALTMVVIAAGGPHASSGESYVWVATFLLATLMWYGLIEGARLWRRRRS